MGTPRIPEDLVLPPVGALVEAQRLLDRGLPFHAHEILEGAWKGADAGERDLWQGLAQLAVGLTHLRRGNRGGAAVLIARSRSRISPYLDHPPHRIDVAGLVAWSDTVLGLVAHSAAEPEVAPPLLRGLLDAEGAGDSVCWLARVCPACGGLDEHPGIVCLTCGAVSTEGVQAG